MKVMHLISNRWNSAITEYALSAIQSLNLAKIECLLCPLSESPAEKRALQYRINVKPFKSFGLTQISKLLRAILEFAPDAIFTYGGPETSLVQILRKLGKLDQKVRIIRFRGQDILIPQNGFKLWKYRLSNQEVDLLITPSMLLKSKYHEQFKVAPVEYVILGCDSNKYRYQAWDGETNRPQILLVGRFDPVKGHGRAFSIFRHLLDHWDYSWGAPPQLHIVGEPANLKVQDLKLRVLESGLLLGEDVILTAERVPDIEKWMSRASVGFISSLDSEIICRVAEEFLMCGTAVFVSGVGSLEEVILDNSFGTSYLNDTDLMAAEKLQRLLHESLREGINGKIKRSQKAQEAFSWQTMSISLARVVKKVSI